jgi:hypothetical protein
LKIPAKDVNWYTKLGGKILCLGRGLEAVGEGDKGELLDDKHISHYDFFAIENSALEAPFVDPAKSSLPDEWESSSFKYVHDFFEGRLNEILEVCEAGSSVLVFLHKPLPVFRRKHVSGTLSLRGLPIFNMVSIGTEY